MAWTPISSQVDLGRRIAEGRETAGMTQAQLAQAVGLERTALVKIESGVRKVSASELFGISTALDVPMDWFVTESPPAVVSRRRDPTVGGHSKALDSRVERLARDVEFLLAQQILPPLQRPKLERPSDFSAAERVAGAAREWMRVADGPIYDLQRCCERVGLLAFTADLGEGAGDAAYVDAGGLGVAVVNTAVEAGRRRFNLAHELAHHLVGDAYAAEVAIPGDESMLNAFVAYFLMPRSAVVIVWDEFAERDRRLAAIAVAARFRTSWSATCNQLCNLGHIDASERDQLLNAPPKRGDFVELGEWWTPELEAASVPPDYGRRIVSAYRCGKLTASRTIELLWNTVSESDLPEVEDVPLEGLQREFDAIS